MNKRKGMSIFVALVMVFTFAFSGLVFGGEAEAATVKSGSSSSATSVKSGDYMYYAVYNSIYKVNVKTKKSTLVYKNSNVFEFYDLTVKDGWIYCVMNTYIGTSSEYPYIFKVKTSGKSPQVLKKGSNPVIYNGSIYYIKESFNENDKNDYNKSVGIYKMSLSGKNDKCIKKSSTMLEFIIYNSKIYYINMNSSRSKNYLRSMSLSGTSTKTMINGSSYIMDTLKAYSGNIYFNYNAKIYKIKTTSTKKSLVLSNSDIRDISGGYIYYNIYKNGDFCFYKMKISNKSKTCIMKNNTIVGDVQISGSYMLLTFYYLNPSDWNENTVKYICNTNGKNGKVLNKYFSS